MAVVPTKKTKDTTKEKLENFLIHLREMPNVARACRLAKISRMEVYNRRQYDVEFSDAWDEALTEGVERLEEVAWRRAEEQSDKLMILLLRAHKPELYGERRDITSGGRPINTPVQFIDVIVPSLPEDDEDDGKDDKKEVEA